MPEAVGLLLLTPVIGAEAAGTAIIGSVTVGSVWNNSAMRCFLEALSDCCCWLPSCGPLKRTEHGRDEWIAGTLELAAALAEARARFKADRQFAVWLAENDLDQLGENDRAALIRMAQEPSLMRDVLTEQEDQLHPITILRKSSNRFGQVSKPDLPAPNPEKMASMPEVETKPADETAEISTPTKPLTKQSPFFGLPRAGMY